MVSAASAASADRPRATAVRVLGGKLFSDVRPSEVMLNSMPAVASWPAFVGAS
jgi:hypothetical protein